MYKLFLVISLAVSSIPRVDIDQSANVGVILHQQADHLFTGSWEGLATTSKEQTRVLLEIRRKGVSLTAQITLMDMGVMGWPAREASSDGKNLSLKFLTDHSEQIFRLHITRDEQGMELLEGSWEDNRLQEQAKVQLRRKLKTKSFHSETVLVDGPEGILSAELIMPSGEGPFPGVVFLHGSGPQPKDANRFAAHSLASHGIASVIFDKRGVGKSTGDWRGADFEDLANDGIAVAEFLASREKISYVGFFGHSQGGWIGPLAAINWEDSSFVISSAGPAVSPAREAEWGFIHQASKNGAKEEDVLLIRHLVVAWHDGLRSGEWGRYKELLAQTHSKPWFEASGLQYLQYPPDPEHSRYYLPFMDYDPIPVLLELQVPLLAILSPDDESIDARETELILAELKASGKDIEIQLFPGYNHGLRKIGKDGEIRWPGFPDDYFELQAAFIKSLNFQD